VYYWIHCLQHQCLYSCAFQTAEDPEYRTRDTDPEEGILAAIVDSAILQEDLKEGFVATHAELVTVEDQCIHEQSLLGDPTSQPAEQWQTLIGLHKTLLDKHHELFLASQHPSAILAMQTMALGRNMLGKMWRNGIYIFLEILRHHLPASHDYMLEFIHIAYSMLALWCKNVPAFTNMWMECLGNVARYGIAIDGEVWRKVSRDWYLKVSNDEPTTGRLYHHLARRVS
jgi:hypothetical protein